MKKFETPKIEIQKFNVCEILTTSILGEIPGDDNDVAWGE